MEPLNACATLVQYPYKMSYKIVTFWLYYLTLFKQNAQNEGIKSELCSFP
jgi:hypothetical protein